MFCTDLILRIMIVLSCLALTLSFPAESNFFKMIDSQQAEEYFTCPVCKTRNVRHQNKIREYLEPIAVKSQNVLGKFEQKEKQLKKFYGQYRQLTNYQSNYRHPSNFVCLHFEQLKKKVSQFQKKIRQNYNLLRKLIRLEKSPKFKKHDIYEGRLKLLEEFLAEIKNLLVELRHSNRPKKGPKRRMAKKATTGNLNHIKSPTKISIEEYKLLNNLKVVLENWARDFKNTIDCM